MLDQVAGAGVSGPPGEGGRGEGSGHRRDPTDEVFAVIAHELQGPLSLIVGYAELLGGDESGRLSDRERGWVEVIERAARKQSRLIRHLILLARLEVGGFEVEPGRCDLAALAAAAPEAVSGRAGEAEIELRLGSKEPPALLGDRARLAQALEALVESAIALSDGDGDLQLTVAAGQGDVVVEISGPHLIVPEPLRDGLFERGLRDLIEVGDGIAAATSIALTAAAAVADAHGGSVEVVGGSGGARLLRMRLPLAPPAVRYRPSGGRRQ